MGRVSDIYKITYRRDVLEYDIPFRLSDGLQSLCATVWPSRYPIYRLVLMLHVFACIYALSNMSSSSGIRLNNEYVCGCVRVYVFIMFVL